MKICTYYTTDRSDCDFVPTVIKAKGETLDDLIPEISDEIAQELAMAEINGESVTIEDHEGIEIEANVGAVCEALHNDTTCIVVKHKPDAGEDYENVFTIHNL